MAIDTTNKKLALMEWCQVWESGLPISPGALGQDDQQQLINDYPGILWGAAIVAAARRYFVQIQYNMARVRRRRR